MQKHITAVWFEIADTSKAIYYSCMTSSNDDIGINEDITLIMK